MLSDITPIIVTFKSQKVIFKCLNCLKNFKKILVLDNSNDLDLKQKLKKKYSNVQFFISKKNLGYAAGHNLLLKKVITKYALLISPDVTINLENINILKNSLKQIPSNFALAGSMKHEEKNINYGYFKKNKKNLTNANYLNVDYIFGYFLLINVAKIKKINFFDSNFFLYNEDIDLCLRAKKNGYKILVIKNLKVNHLSAKSSDIGEEYIKCKNWHWMWSKFYLQTKINGYFVSLLIYFPNFFKLLIKLPIMYFINKHNFLNIKFRFYGLLNSMLKKKSYYRPTLK